MIPNRTSIFLFVLLLSSCSSKEICQQCNDEISIVANTSNFITKGKTTTELMYQVFSNKSDKIGVFSHNISGSQNQFTPQIPFSAYSLSINSTTFRGTGWGLNNTGDYMYYAYYPYNENHSHDKIQLNYSSQTQKGNNSVEHLKDYDFLISTAKLPTSTRDVSFEFEHINSLITLNIDVPDKWRDSEFLRMVFRTDDNIFVDEMSYNVSSICNNGNPAFENIQYSNSIKVDYENVVADQGTITSSFMMYPCKLAGKPIYVDVYPKCDDYTILRDTITIPENPIQGYRYSFDVKVNEQNGILPPKRNKEDNLYILLIGHSFGVDATEYVPHLADKANIKNVSFGRFYSPNCSLEKHYSFFLENKKYAYQYCTSGDDRWQWLQKTLYEVLIETPWDIVVFQQSILTSGAGDYSTYQPYLNNLIDIVKSICYKTHEKVPYIGWHYFWATNSTSYSTEFAAIKSATKQMMNETGIQLIIPTGVAVDIARGGELKDQIYRDGWHCSIGIGRYLGACTWFETILKPIYGVSVVGNTLVMPARLEKEFDSGEDAAFYKVDSQSAKVLQEYALEAANKIPHYFD